MRKSEVRKWPEMDRQQKIQYLKDYYLYAAVIDEFLDEKKLAQVTADMSNLLGADGKRKTVQIDDLFMSKMEPWINFRFIFTVSRSMW